MIMIEYVQKWLAQNGNPEVCLLEDIKESFKIKKPVKYLLNHSLTTMLAINNSDESPYSVNYTPNWNYGRLNAEWGTVTHKQSDAEDAIYCFYIDLDKKFSPTYKTKSMEEYKKYILSTIQEMQWKPQYLIQTGWGFHLYMYVNPNEVYQIWERFKSEFKEIQEYFASAFEWWDDSVHWMQKLMRLPFTNHWKTWTKIPLKAYEIIYTDILSPDSIEYGHAELKEITSPDQITLEWKYTLTLQWLELFVDNQKKPKMTKKYKEFIESPITQQVNALSFQDIFKRIWEYPRMYQDKQYKFVLDGANINLIIDWAKKLTDWYKLWIDKNIVKNFSWMHSKEERPCGKVRDFLRWYFSDMVEMGNFLEKEYNINISWWEYYMKLPADRWEITFMNNCVIYNYWEKTSKGWIIQQKLFDVPVIIKGIVRTNFEMKWESEDENVYYLLTVKQNNWTEKHLRITYQADRKRFNNAYWWKGLRFSWWENDLNEFYNAIDKAAASWVVREFEYIYLNWYYKQFYVIWDDMYDWYWNPIDIDETNIVLETQKIPRFRPEKKCTMWEFWDMLRKLFNDRESILSYLCFVSELLWTKFRQPILAWKKQQIIIPWLFLSWPSKTWKSTLITILKNGFTLDWDARRLSALGTSDQPLKQWATDDFILHLEEYTWASKNHDRSNLLREILNKGESQRWLQDGSNVVYKYKSNLVLDWEQAPGAESVTNRLVFIPMELEWRIGNEDLLENITQYSYFNDFMSTLYNLELDTVHSAFLAAQKRLIKLGIRDRYSMIYAYLLCVNEWFNIFFEDEVVKAIKDNMNIRSVVDWNKSVLSSLLSEIITTRRINPTQLDTEEWYNILVPLPDDILQTRQVDLIIIYKTYWSERIEINWNILVLKLNSKDKSEQNIKLYNTVAMYSRSFQKTTFLDIDGI